MTTTTTPPAITFDDIVNLGKKRVDELATHEVPALGGSVVLRQLSGAEQDRANAAGFRPDGTFDAHAVVLEQIKYSMVEPKLPPDELNADGTIKRSEANEILDGLPVGAFGQLQMIVQANSGLNAIGVEEMVATFRRAADASGADGDGSAIDSGPALDEPEGVGDADADADDEAAGVLPGDEPDAGTGSEASGEDREAAEEAAGVTA